MPTIDDFTRPKEWIPDMALEMGKVLRQWGENRYVPVRRKIDEDWKEHKIVGPLFKEVMVDLNLNKSVWPAEVGGLDLPDTATLAAVVFEELGRLDCGFAVAVACAFWPILPIALEPHRNWELIREFGPKFCGDELYIGSLAMTEPQGGSDIENVDRMQGKTIQTRAELDGDEWVINGHKLWPTNSGRVGDLYGVVCQTDPKEGEEGIALIYVPASTDGVSVGEPYQKAGMAADMNSDIYFDNVRVPKEYRAHGPGLDAKYFREIITYGNLGTAAFSLGVMKNTYELVKDWATQRVVAGKPLKEHSMNAAILAEIATAIEVSSTNLYMAARMVDHPETYGSPWSQAMVAKTRATSLFCSDMAVMCTNKAMELMASHGYSREGDIEKHWRDSKMLTLWMGGRQLDLMEIARYFYECETL